MYKLNSLKAEEFIDHQEVLDTLEYARTHKSNRALIEQLIEKAAQCKGLTHREAALLLECDQPELTTASSTSPKKSNRSSTATAL